MKPIYMFCFTIELQNQIGKDTLKDIILQLVHPNHASRKYLTNEIHLLLFNRLPKQDIKYFVKSDLTISEFDMTMKFNLYKCDQLWTYKYFVPGTC